MGSEGVRSSMPQGATMSQDSGREVVSDSFLGIIRMAVEAIGIMVGDWVSRGVVLVLEEGQHRGIRLGGRQNSLIYMEIERWRE